MRAIAGAFALVCLAASSAIAATITVVNLDAVGEGFNDTTVMAPVGGNSGTTLGEQRLIAFEYAASIWGTELNSSVEIRVGASFDPLFCEASRAVLGQAGPVSYLRDFAQASLAATWYPVALANKIAGSDLDPGADDITARFNSSLGTTCSFPKGWYFGLDATPPGSEIDFVTVVLHELGHGLGQVSTVSLATGAKLLGLDDVYVRHLEDHDTGVLYPDMSNTQRVSASTNTGRLHWVGAAVSVASMGLVSGRDTSGHVEMYAPNPASAGSSVSHFSTSLSPDELMEPHFTSELHDVGLARAVMSDMGWGGSACGNGVVDAGEDCDDGNVLRGDCCSSLCMFEPSGSVCSDGDPCTQDDRCNTSGGCLGGAPSDCNDGNACTDDWCDPAVGCVNTDNTVSCDDGLTCTTPDTCSLGGCAGVWNAQACALGAFKAYKSRRASRAAKFAKTTLMLSNPWEAKATLLSKPGALALPVDSNGEGISVAEISLQCYKAKDVGSQPRFAGRVVEVVDELGTMQLVLNRAGYVCGPAASDPAVTPAALAVNRRDTFKCYRAANRGARFQRVSRQLADQLEAKMTMVIRPQVLCTPVDVDGAGIFDVDTNLTCYKIRDEKGQPKFARTSMFETDALATLSLQLVKAKWLCLPATLNDLGLP